MKRSTLFIATASILAAASALAQTPSPSPRAPEPNTQNREISKPASPHDSTANPTADRNIDRDGTTVGSTEKGNRNMPNSGAMGGDEKFLRDFARANAAEVQAGKLAEQQAQNADVKAYGKHMVDEHSKVIKKVETVATNLNIDVKSQPSAMQQAKSSVMDGKRGADFDVAYMNSQVSDHEKVAELLKKQVREGSDASVKKLASDALPSVQQHLEQAKQLQAKVAKAS